MTEKVLLGMLKLIETINEVVKSQRSSINILMETIDQQTDNIELLAHRIKTIETKILKHDH